MFWRIIVIISGAILLLDRFINLSTRDLICVALFFILGMLHEVIKDAVITAIKETKEE